jgi:hypothetical protein
MRGRLAFAIDLGNVTLKTIYKLPNLNEVLWKGRPFSKTVLISSGLITSPGLF